MTLNSLFLVLKVKSRGRGNFGHAGRPGKRGGSAPSRIKSIRNSIVENLDYESDQHDEFSRLRKIILTSSTMREFRKEFEGNPSLNKAFDKLTTPSSTVLYKGTDQVDFGVGEEVTFNIPTFTSRDENHAKFYGKGKILVFPKGSMSLRLGITDDSEKAELLKGIFRISAIKDNYVFLR